MSDNTNNSPMTSPRPATRLRFLLALVQARLRFVLLVGTIFLLAAAWPRLADYWDRTAQWATGATRSERGISADTEYFCPMCPGVLAAWPEKCPVCKMPLVRRKRGEAALLPEGVVARMQLSPYRIQLAGIKTSPAAYLPLERKLRVAGSAERRAVPDNAAMLWRVKARLSPLDVPFAAAGQPAEVRIPGSAVPLRLEGSVVAVTPRNDGQDGFDLEVEVANSAAMDPAVPLEVTLRRSLASLEPFASRPRNPPPLDKSVPRSVFLCPDHPTYLHLAAGKCPFDENTLHKHPLLPNQRLDWWCPVHPEKNQFPPGECEHCEGQALQPRILTYAPQGQVLSIPESAVVDTGEAQFVFVESMPGMFDCVGVEVATPVNGQYPVISGLAPGQLVASSGAFLLDAETRLNPSLAASYFGAGQRESNFSSSTKVAAGPAQADVLNSLKLTTAQLLLARRQKVCPITKMPLGSMGELVEIDVGGKRVFLCCEGCRSRVKVRQPASSTGRSEAPTGGP